MSIRVLFISPYISFAYGGTSKVVVELATALSRSGTEVDLVTTTADVDTTLEVPVQRWLKRDGYRIQYFPCWHRNDFVVSRQLLSWLIKTVGQYDIVHTHTLFSPLISLCHWVCQLQGVPYVTSPHGMLEPWAMQHKLKKKETYFSLIERQNLAKASFVHSIASREAENISRLCNEATIQLAPNGVDKSKFSPPVAANHFYQKYPELASKRIILFLGRIDPKKGLDLLAPAFGAAHQSASEAHLVIAGPDSVGYQATVEQHLEDANCLEAVTFTGMLTGDLKYAALAAAEIYVAPSYSEGFSMSVLEGMASGLPCVITEGCNFPEAAENDAAVVVEANATALADALTACLASPKEAKAMGDRARQFIFENYTWDQAAQKLTREYKKILGGLKPQ